MKIIDSNKFFLKGTNSRFLHLATIHHSVREFMCFADLHTNKVYIEEVTGGQLSFIEDDSLAEGIARFLEMHNITNAKTPLVPYRLQ